jgi:Bacteriophage T4-like portal protein (Gp20)
MSVDTTQDQSWNLFGFQIKKKQDSKQVPESFVSPTNDDGGAVIEIGSSSGAAYNSYSIDLDPSSAKNEAELINKYREISLVSDIDVAVDEIVNELLIYDEYKPPLDIDFTEDFAKQYSEKTKEIIKEEFTGILSMLNFNISGSDIVRTWYVDGRLAYHKVINKDTPKLGIVELRPIDSVKLKKITEVKKEKDSRTGVDIVKSQEEYFVYSELGFTGNEKQGLKIAKDAIAYVTSGAVDKTSGRVLSYLHKAIRPMNQLRMMEDSEVIYRMGRAPQRRIFYIDTNGMARTKAEQHIKDVMARYKNKQVYDAQTGTVTDSKKHLSILEDYWMPRSNGSKGTEITTLEGGGTLGDPSSVTYYQNKLYQSLNIPMSRLQANQSAFNMGRENEISRDEVKFSKFIDKLRRKLNGFFLDILRTQLILKGVATAEDWEVIKGEILFNYVEDNFYAEIKESEMLKERMINVQAADPYVGKYFSKRFIQREILKLTDEQIKDMEEENAEDEQLLQQQQDAMMQELGIDPNDPTGEAPAPQQGKTK